MPGRSVAEKILRRLKLAARVAATGHADTPGDFTAGELATLAAVSPHTMTSPERVVSLVRAVEHVHRHEVEGDVVECGVWRGGSMMAVARTLLALGDTSRTLHLFDTFEGMPPPTEHDTAVMGGGRAGEMMASEDPETSVVWAKAGEDVARRNLASTGYPSGRTRFVRGKVEDTIPGEAPDRIAILRLDTDWYESTRHEMEHLWPRLAPGGIIIVDDYGHWSGAKKAVDEYLEAHRIPLFLARVDYTGRIAVKPG